MSDSLWRIREVCGQLSDSKVTTRKKAEGTLRDLLNNPGIVAALGDVVGGSGDFSWMHVYGAVYTFLRLESEKLKVDGLKEKQSKNAEGNRINRKREIMSLFKLVIRKAGKGLRWASVVNKLLSMLENDFMKSLFADDIVKILNDIVSDPICQSTLSVSGLDEGHQWEQILNAVMTLLFEAPENLNSWTAIKLLNSTIKHGSRVCNMTRILFTPKLIKLLTGLLTSNRFSARPDSPAKLEAISAATQFCSLAALDFRLEVCKLGEDTVHCVLPAWDERNISNHPLLPFLDLQMRIHHPDGAMDENTGALFFNREEWKRQLLRLHQNIVDTTIRNKLRQNKTRGTRISADYELCEDFLSLCVMILRQTLNQGASQCNVTQLVQLDTTQVDGPSAKRLRLDGSRDVNQLDTSFRSFLDNITSPADNDLCKIPWLQILARLLARFPDMFPPDVINQVVRALSSLLQGTKTVATKKHCLDACLNLVHLTGLNASSDWETITRTTFNLISMNQAGVQGHTLYQELLQRNSSLLPVDQIYSLFTNHLVKLSPQTSDTLLFLLSNKPLTTSHRDIAHRQSLVNWLFPEDEESSGTGSAGDPHKLGSLLAALAFTRVDPVRLDTSPKYSVCPVEGNLLALSHIVQLVQEDRSAAVSLGQGRIRGNLLPEVYAEVEKLMLKEACSVISTVEINGAGVNSLLREATIFMQFLHRIHQLQSTDDTPSGRSVGKLTSMMKLLVKKAREISAKYLKRNEKKEFSVSPVFDTWTNFFNNISSFGSLDVSFLFGEELNMKALMDQVLMIISETCELKEKRMKPPETQGSDSGHNPFDDFDDITPSTESNGGDDFSADMTSLEDAPAEEAETDFLRIMFSALVSFYAPGRENCWADDVGQVDGQLSIVEHVMRMLDVYSFSERSLDVTVSTLQAILKQAGIETIDKVSSILKEIAKVSMKSQMFDHKGMEAILKIINSLVKPSIRLGSNKCGMVIQRTLQVLMEQNVKLQYSRFSTEFSLHLIQTISKLGAADGPSWMEWPADIHNQAVSGDSSLGLDTDEEVLIGRSLPRFLLHPSQLVRIHALKLILQDPEFDAHKFYQDTLQKAINDLLNVSEFKHLENSEKNSRIVFILLLCSSIACRDPSFTRYAVSSVIICMKKENSDLSLVPFVSLIARNTESTHENVIKTHLPDIMCDFLEDGHSFQEFPIYLMGFQPGEVNRFLVENEMEIVPIILFAAGTKDAVEDLSRRLEASPEDLVSRNVSKLLQVSLPGMAAKEFNVPAQNKSNMIKLSNLILSVIGQKNAIPSIQKELAPIISQCFSSISEIGDMCKLFNLKPFTSMKPTPPVLSGKLAETVIEFLSQTFARDIYNYLCERHPQCITQIAVELCAKLNSDLDQSNLKCLYSIHFWLQNIFEKTRDLGHTLPLLTLFVSHQLLSFAKRQANENCRRCALEVLEKLIRHVLSISEISIKNCAVEINTCLVAIIKDDPDSGSSKVALQILDFLFVENIKRFESIAVNVEDYPSLAQFAVLTSSVGKFRQDLSLKLLIKNVLHTTEKVPYMFCENILFNLKERLRTSAFEVSNTFDIDNDRIIQLIERLLDISKSQIQPVSEHAMSCLGSIGPLELKSQTDHLEENVQIVDPEKPSKGYVISIIKELKKILITESDLSSEVYSVICAIFNKTSAGRELNLAQLNGDLGILEPLRNKAKKNLIDQSLLVNCHQLIKDIDQAALWIFSSTDYEEWVKDLNSTIIGHMADNSVLGVIKPLCLKSCQLSELMLPYAIQECLLHSDGDLRLVVSARICQFFEDVFEHSKEYSNKDGQPLCKERLLKIIEMLKIVSYVRQQELPMTIFSNETKEKWERNFLIVGLNYLHVAKAALLCGDYSAAILYCDIWCNQQALTLPQERQEQWNSLLANIDTDDHSKTAYFRTIYMTAFKETEDNDSYEGTKTILKNISDAEVVFENLPLLDVKAFEKSSQVHNLLLGLYNSGMFHVLNQYLESYTSRDTSPALRDFQAECSWRLGEWDRLYPIDSDIPFNATIYGCLQGCHNSDKEQIKAWADRSTKTVLQDIKTLNMETSSEVSSVLLKLKQIDELRTVSEAKSLEDIVRIIDDTTKTDLTNHGDLKKLETLFSQRCSILDSILSKSNPLKDQIYKLSLRLCQISRDCGNLGFCNRIIEKFKHCTLDFRLEEAKLTWAKGKPNQGILLAKNLQNDVESLSVRSAESEHILPDLLVTLGHWLDQQHSESSANILSNYFSKAVELLKNAAVPDEKSLVAAHLGLANLADQQFRKADEYINSNEFNEKKESILAREREGKFLKGDQEKSVRTAFVIKARFLAMDKREIEQCSSERESYLHISIGNYLSVMKHGDQSVAVYRMLSLWFANSEDPSVNSIVSKTLPTIPTYRLVPLLYQMAARMSDTNDKSDTDFSVILYKVIKCCAKEHPHHALPIIFALYNASLDEVMEKKVKQETLALDERGKAASNMIKQLHKLPEHADTVTKYMDLTSGLVEVAYLPIPKNNARGTIGIPSSKYTKIKDWNNIPVLTDKIPARPDCDYSGYPGITKFEPYFKLVGGINAPKKTECLGTDGIRRPQMIKGMDDLRQDAVMQQVFALTNQLFDEDRETRAQKLKVRTYKIVPLSQRSGILEWCSNTTPIGSILNDDGKGGVHKRYFPDKMSFKECRAQYMSNKFSQNPKKTFEKICENFPPAFKFFFLEQFPGVTEYLRAKHCYTKSVSTTSMVGHILGIGDRHLNNILVDLKTAELVHIDFGIAFDKGKILPSPELIPFRLSRDIIDGFGPLGVEGLFRRNCERSLRVLRANKDKLLTVVEVMVHDPLYDWSVGPSKAAAKQKGEWEKLKEEECGQGNRMANRALIVLVSKLEGREQGSALSVEGQVGALIREATDPGNLCKTFNGWSAWC